MHGTARRYRQIVGGVKILSLSFKINFRVVSPAQQTPDTLAVPLLGLAVVATQLGPASRTGLDSARLGVPVGPRAAAHATLGPDA